MRCTFVKNIMQVTENGFCVSKYSTKDEAVPMEARDKGDPAGVISFTATGFMLPLTNIVDVELEGVWQKHERYGLQFKVEHHEEIMPQTAAGIAGYLGSGLIKGIGPKTAKVIVDRFGIGTMDILENHPERLVEIKGISSGRLESIKASLSESRAMRDIVSYLSPYGVSVKKAAKIQKEFGGEAMRILKTQPFRLCSISGFGFKTVDQIARQTRCNLSDALRIRGGLIYLLDEAALSGHLFLPADELAGKTHTMLNEGLEQEIIDISEVRSQMEEMLKEGLLQSDIGRFYKPACRKAEVIVARGILKMLEEKVDFNADIEKEMDESQKKLGIRLADKQKDAVRMWFSGMLSIITGGPGTGKTTVLQVILDIYQRIQPDGEILLTAPTGRASRRMVEATGYPSASTLHSALGLVSDEEDGYYGERFPVAANFVILDEVSMVDMLLAGELFSRIEPGTQLLLVGDPDQLPSVGPGNVLRELIRCGLIPVTHLDMVYRQKENSRIALNAHAINHGDTKGLSYGDDFVFQKADNANDAAKAVLDIYLEEIAQHGIENVQILAPFKTRGEASVLKLNERGRELVNPPAVGKAEHKSGARVYRAGDKVLQTKNRDAVSNGDIGFIGKIEETEDESAVKVRFGDTCEVSYGPDDLDQLELAYATTIHKSMGSEYRSVIIPLLKEQYIMLRRNLIYTAITRAREKITLVGQKQALYIAISNSDVDKRNTLLADRIVSYYRKLQASKTSLKAQ